MSAPGGAGASRSGVGRSALAVVAGFVAIVVLSVGTDAVMHATGVFPPPGRPMHGTALLGLAAEMPRRERSN